MQFPSANGNSPSDFQQDGLVVGSETRPTFNPPDAPPSRAALASTTKSVRLSKWEALAATFCWFCLTAHLFVAAPLVVGLLFAGFILGGFCYHTFITWPQS